MGEDNKKLKKLHIIDGATGEEIPVTPIKELVFSEKEVIPVKDIKWVEVANTNIDKFNEQVQKECENFAELQKEFAGVATTLEFNLKDFQESTRIFMKLFGLTPITKKRARKLLMAHGYDRNKANQTLKFLHKRTLNEIKKYFIF